MSRSILLMLFSRIFAPKCAACGEAITPVEGTEETVRVVAMEKDFHVDCYVCEVRNDMNIEWGIRIALGKYWYRFFTLISTNGLRVNLE